MAQTISVDERITSFMDQVLRAEDIQEAFAAYIVPQDNLKKECCFDITRKFWVTLPSEQQNAALIILVSKTFLLTNRTKAALMFDILEELVQSNMVPARPVCEAILMSDKLTWSDSISWIASLKLIRKIIGGVDYKGCRDLLRMILEIAQTIPPAENVRTLELVDSIIEVVSYILNRNSCLLPGYFAVNEITKLCSDNKPWPHWKMGQLLADFVQTFRNAAHIVTVAGRPELMPIVGHSNASSNVWKLHPATLKFSLSGPLPYDKSLNEPQKQLLRYVLDQPYSRDMVTQMLSLNKATKQRCHVLEDRLVDMLLMAMERSEKEEEESDASQLLWQHISSQLIFFVLFSFASFPHMVLALYGKLKLKKFKKGRDHLMWVLLQFISGSISKNPLKDFLPVIKLHDLLYPEGSPLMVPDVNKASSTHALAVTCIWIHLSKKAEQTKDRLPRSLPNVLKLHLEFLKQSYDNESLPTTDFRIALLCNAYSTNPEIFAGPMAVLVDSISGKQIGEPANVSLPGNVQAAAPTKPLSMSLLDSLTVHAKMSLIHNIVTKILKLAQAGGIALAPALIETYSRLLVYIEIEGLGIKGYITQVLPNVFKSHSYGLLHMLLEMFTYRLHHVQPLYRVQLLSLLQTLASYNQTNQNQIHLCIENTSLRLIMGLGNSEVQPNLSRVLTDPKTNILFSQESEEQNRVLVLTLARAMHITMSESTNWCRELLNDIKKATPLSWSSHTLACFPPALAEYFQQNPCARDDKNVLKKNVDMEYRRWKSMASENDLISHFSTAGPNSLFLCVLWRSLLEDNRISPTAFKVLEIIGARALTSHIRTFCDYLVHEFSSAGGNTQLTKCVEKLNDLIWKCNVVSFDRLIFCLALRCLEGNEARVCFYIIHLLLLKPSDFRLRVQEFVSKSNGDYWKQDNWHEQHMNYHQKFPEKFYFEGLQQDPDAPSKHQYLPVYFGNVCLRFLPVFDIIIHRYLELEPVTKSLDNIFENLGSLYKFHDHPMTYLYNTLHYYERRLEDRPALKKRLVQVIICSAKSRPPNWCLTQDYLNYLKRGQEDTTWNLDQDYLLRLVGRLVDTIGGNSSFPIVDWRFNEFPNQAAHALYATCIELLALPLPSREVCKALIDVIINRLPMIPREKIMSWMNAFGLILTSLPVSYAAVLEGEILVTLQSPALSTPSPDMDPFLMFNFSETFPVAGEHHAGVILALCHSMWQHSSIGQLSPLSVFIRDEVKPLVKTEEQFLFVCHLVGPFLSRFHAERTRCLLDLAVELYEMLEAVDANSSHLQYMDSIADFLYHIKYMFVGDGVKAEVEKVIRNIRPALQLRLRFISHLGKEDSSTPS